MKFKLSKEEEVNKEVIAKKLKKEETIYFKEEVELLKIRELRYKNIKRNPSEEE